MYASKADVPTDRAARYLTQLCKHSDHVNGLAGGHADRSGHGGNGAAVHLQRVEWSDTEGVIRFAEGRCAMHATNTRLLLDAEADSPERLQRIQAAITARLERIGRRDRLTVVWSPVEPGSAPHAGGASP
ncbi:DUF2218 domain-containing protein [Actinomadura nitritigenes]|uniref:DUF2218 domain-containing protein n=1 Tax=Actinomadura nitritigenes TaxID=134602 RepID=UPI0036A9C426